ncbi:MAG: hypothetical protein JO228_03165, partial [Xanthobacteraceae bacterium]|nr:hypothetical protein [Xanthobacteraceae bacterium]
MTELSPARQDPVPAPRRQADALGKLIAKVKGDHLIYIASILGMIALWQVVATAFF